MYIMMKHESLFKSYDQRITSVLIQDTSLVIYKQ